MTSHRRTGRAYRASREKVDAAKVKKSRTSIEFMVWQAQHIGWPALEASWTRTLAEFNAKHGGGK